MTFPPQTYLASRDLFRAYLDPIRGHWPKAKLISKPLPREEDLSLDWIRADAKRGCRKLFLLTTGEHGVEGYVGAVIMKLFMEEFLPRLNPEDTGIVLVHPINPWGMKHKRRTNGFNVDLNRNFLADLVDFQCLSNPDYARLNDFLNPEGELGNYSWEKIAFFFRALGKTLIMGSERLKAATLLGQYRFPRGVYYGGDRYQFETRTMMDLYRDCLSSYANLVHVDIHTGYGSRDQMTVVNSALEARSPAELERAYGYAPIVAADPDQFYSMRGDMIDWCYAMMKKSYPEIRYYGTAFEFSTVGEDIFTALTSLRTTIFENQAHWYGIADPEDHQRLKADYLNLYFPGEKRWVRKALQDAHQALTGILQARDFLV